MVGVRLARNVRLPAASFANSPDLFASPEIATANQEIENRFYRELLDQTLHTLREHSDPDVPSDETDGIPIDENGEKTVTVEPGVETDRALDRSDEAFRSLFGNDAYNRRKMDGAVELGASNNQSGN